MGFYGDYGRCGCCVAHVCAVQWLISQFAQKPGRRRGYVKWRDPVGDTRSALHYLEQGALTRKEWMKSLTGPCVSTLFAWDDPGPWVSDLFRRGVGRLKRFLKRSEETP